MMKNVKIGWPAVVLVSVAIASLAMVLTFAPEDTQDSVVEWLGWAFAGISQLVGPILRRRLAEESEAGNDGK